MYYLQQLVDVERIQFRICLSFLLEVRAIGLIDMFDICNIYVLQDFEALWNEAVLTDMLSYCRFQPSHNPHRIESSHAAVFAEAGEESDFGDLQAILSLFHSNISVLQIIQTPSSKRSRTPSTSIVSSSIAAFITSSSAFTSYRCGPPIPRAFRVCSTTRSA